MNTIHKNSLVSVVIPIYNTEKYLPRCIQSVLDQTHTNLELLLVEDGSPDNCGAICDEFAKKDPRIRVFHKPNGGVSRARNTGIENARGDYLLFIDSDDWVEPNHIESLLPIGDEDLVYGGIKLFVNSRFVEARTIPNQIVEQEAWLSDFSGFVSKGLTVFFITPCYRMSLIRANNIRFDTALGVSEDGLFNLAYMKHCRKIRYSDTSTYCYEDGDDTSTSLSHSFHPNRMQASMEESKMIESITGKDEYMMRFHHWKVTQRHYRHWVTFKNGLRKQEAQKLLNASYQEPYFRASIPYVRSHGSLDQRVETFFMRPWLYPLFKPFYDCIVWVSNLKKKIFK